MVSDGKSRLYDTDGTTILAVDDVAVNEQAWERAQELGYDVYLPAQTNLVEGGEG